jgi:hypothetical protein
VEHSVAVSVVCYQRVNAAGRRSACELPTGARFLRDGWSSTHRNNSLLSPFRFLLYRRRVSSTGRATDKAKTRLRIVEEERDREGDEGCDKRHLKANDSIASVHEGNSST